MGRNAEVTDGLNGLKAQFLAGLSHEIRTPLTGVLGMLDLLLETDLTDEQKDFVGAAHICADSLLEMMNLTLEYSALSANQIILEEVEFSPGNLIAMLEEEFSPKAAEKGLTLKCNVAADLPAIAIGDERHLKELLSHLLGNAVKFTPAGTVVLAASAGPARNGEIQLALSVSDTGIGIPEEKLDSIFDYLSQLEGGLSRRYSGMGLGLAVTQKLVNLMQAQLLVRSEVGKGSTFSVILPLRVALDTAQSVAEEVSPDGLLLPRELLFT